MAKNSSQSADSGELKILILVDCIAGKSGQVVDVDAATAKALVASGEADDNAAAIAAHEH